MSNYDGPSFYKKHHPKVESIRRNSAAKKQGKTSWVDQDDHYENRHKKSLPDRIRTRNDFEDDAEDYMKMPVDRNDSANEVDVVTTGQRNKPLTRKIDDEKKRAERNRFRHKHIPTSLQKLGGWHKPAANLKLLEALRERLAKDADSYILFAAEDDDGFDSVKTEVQLAKIPDSEPEVKVEAKSKPQPQKKKVKSKDFSLKDKKKAERIKVDITSKLRRPGSGLHRSLSGIMAEDQQDYENGRHHLDSLFSAKK